MVATVCMFVSAACMQSSFSHRRRSMQKMTQTRRNFVEGDSKSVCPPFRALFISGFFSRSKIFAVVGTRSVSSHKSSSQAAMMAARRFLLAVVTLLVVACPLSAGFSSSNVLS